MRSAVKAAKRIVVKIGTSSLTHENGRVDLNKYQWNQMTLDMLK